MLDAFESDGHVIAKWDELGTDLGEGSLENLIPPLFVHQSGYLKGEFNYEPIQIVADYLKWTENYTDAQCVDRAEEWAWCMITLEKLIPPLFVHQSGYSMGSFNYKPIQIVADYLKWTENYTDAQCVDRAEEWAWCMITGD